jgi:hypothetical protein
VSFIFLLFLFFYQGSTENHFCEWTPWLNIVIIIIIILSAKAIASLYSMQFCISYDMSITRPKNWQRINVFNFLLTKKYRYIVNYGTIHYLWLGVGWQKKEVGHEVFLTEKGGT